MMKSWFLVLVVLVSFVSVVSSDDEGKEAVPSFMLTNWKDRMMAWTSAKNCVHAKDIQYPGVVRLSMAPDLTQSAIIHDSFSVKFGDKVFGDPTLFSHSVLNGGCVLERSGRLSVLYDTYNGAKLPFTLEVAILFPPGEDFYSVEYTINPASSFVSGHFHDGISVSLLSFAESPVFNDCQSSASFNAEIGSFVTDMTKCGGLFFLSAVTSNGTDVIHSVFPTDSTMAPLPVFANNGSIDPSDSAQGNGIQNAFLFTKALASDSTVRFSVLRASFVSEDDLASFSRKMTSDPSSFKNDAVGQRVETVYDDFLKRSVIDTSSLPDGEKELFEISLLCLKNAQNPFLGPIVASFHPLYGYKTWSRDAVFSSVILTAAGYRDEAKQFIEWAATAERRDDGAFHTCYDVFTGLPAPFVEPQYDGTGFYLFSMLYYVKVTQDSSVFSDNVVKRVHEIEDFFLQNKGSFDLVPADYSIWEESSDPHSGKPLPTQYYTFTQVMGWTGLFAASILERDYLKNPSRAENLVQRCGTLQSGIMSHLFNEENGYFMRGLWSDTLVADERVDGSSAAAVFSGFCKGDSALSHLSMINRNLTRRNFGIARYADDPFFFDGVFSPCGMEVGAISPPWGVTTMFTAFGELALGKSVQDRLSWMVETSAAGFVPVGEAVDGAGPGFVHASCPDVYEHGGVFILAELLSRGLAKPLNPSLL